MLIGIISDTHGHVSPEVVQALQDSQLIIHAGDIGKPSVLDILKEIAPVIAVRGKIDKENWAKTLPKKAKIVRRIYSDYIEGNGKAK